MRVAILPTGLTEWHGLYLALEKLFPGHQFYQVPTQAEVDSDPGRFPYRGFTSSTLKPGALNDPPEDAADLISRALQEALGDRHREVADLVVVIDDLEIANVHQASHVVGVFRAAAVQHLSSVSGNVRLKTTTVLRERVSFHLLVPMIESWFFADPTAPARAGVPPERPVALDVNDDPEEFLTADPQYLSATEDSCPCWVSKGRTKGTRPAWLGTLPRERHPKGYLQWLCRDGEDSHCTKYGESTTGADALKGLHWGLVLSRPSPQLKYLASLIDDIADALGQQPVTGQLDRALAPLTARVSKNPLPLLRNL